MTTNILADHSPYVVMRTSTNQTQAALAKRSNLSAQYIRRLEIGTVSAPADAVNRAVFEYTEQFPNLRDLLRQKTYLSLNHILSYAKSLTGEAPTLPYVKWQTLREFNIFVEAWYDLWVKTSRRAVTSQDLEATDTVYGLCRLLLLHPFSVQTWLKKTREGKSCVIPREVFTACAQAGLSVRHFTEVARSLDSQND